jgi:hypothetical protein
VIRFYPSFTFFKDPSFLFHPQIHGFLPSFSLYGSSGLLKKSNHVINHLIMQYQPFLWQMKDDKLWRHRVAPEEHFGRALSTTGVFGSRIWAEPGPRGAATPRLVACFYPRAWLPCCSPPAAACIPSYAQIPRLSRARLARCKRGRWRPKFLAARVQAGEEEADAGKLGLPPPVRAIPPCYKVTSTLFFSASAILAPRARPLLLH